MEPRRRIKRDGFDFSVSASADINAFADTLSRIDQIIREGSLVKDSRTTTAAICDIPDCGVVFLKRTNRKGLRFILRYLFRRARSFRAAKAADRLLEGGIETPKVIAVGEYRPRWFLHAGYLITEYKAEAVAAFKALRFAENPESELNRILDSAGKILAEMHLQKIVHNDFKLPNLYFLPDSTCGIWDLDGAKISPSPLSLKQVLPDLTRLVRSIQECCKKREDSFQPDMPAMCSKLARIYTSVYPVFPQDVEAALRNAL